MKDKSADDTITIIILCVSFLQITMDEKQSIFLLRKQHLICPKIKLFVPHNQNSKNNDNYEHIL